LGTVAFKAIRFLSVTLDVIVGLIGCLAALVLIIIGSMKGSFSTLSVGVAILVSCIIYMAIRNKLGNNEHWEINLPRPVLQALDILFFLALISILYINYTYPIRPVVYFVLISAVVSIVSFEVLCYRPGGARLYAILIKILIIAFVIREGMYYEYPGFIGADEWIHMTSILAWKDLGHLTPSIINVPNGYNGYSDFPMMHLQVITLMLSTQLNVKDCMFLSPGFLNILCIIFIYLIGKFMKDEKIGLFAALLVSVSSFYVVMGSVTIPTTFGLGLFTIILYLIYKGKKSYPYYILYVILVFCLVNAHTIAAFIMLVTIGLIYVCNFLYKTTGLQRSKEIHVDMNIVIMFTIILLIKWMYNQYYSFDHSFFNREIAWLSDTTYSDIRMVGSITQNNLSSPFAMIWLVLFICFVIIGALSWINDRHYNNSRLTAIAAPLGLAVVASFSMIMNVGNILPTRWMGFILVMAVILMAQGLSVFNKVIGSKRWGAIMVVGAVLTFTLFSLNTSSVNMDSPLYENHGRTQFTRAELATLDTIVKIYNKSITTDHDYAEYPLMAKGAEYLYYLNIYNNDMGLVLLRDYIYDHENLIGYNWDTSNINRDRFSVSEGRGPDILSKYGFYDNIYDCGSVKGYLKN
jgi:hypothetical protein